MNLSETTDPFVVLGVSQYADEAEIRSRYLELVKKHPPEKDPAKFQEIRVAFEAAKDPLSLAQRLLAPPNDTAPEWSDVLKEQKQNPPRLTPAFILSLGNRAKDDVANPSAAS